MNRPVVSNKSNISRSLPFCPALTSFLALLYYVILGWCAFVPLVAGRKHAVCDGHTDMVTWRMVQLERAVVRLGDRVEDLAMQPALASAHLEGSILKFTHAQEEVSQRLQELTSAVQQLAVPAGPTAAWPANRRELAALGGLLLSAGLLVGCLWGRRSHSASH